MHRAITAMLFAIPFATAICVSGMAAAETPSYIGEHVSTPEDIRAITKVAEDFRQALINKNSRQLSMLMLNSNILFSRSVSPQQIRDVNEKYDAHFDGVVSGGFAEFAQFVSTKAQQPEEKFYNMKITQDGNIAWVMFDYEFLERKKMRNYGVESWQLIKAADDQWKIASIMWSSHPAPQN